MTVKKHSLLEAAAEIFQGGVVSKRAQADSFGLGADLHNKPMQITDLGPAHIKASEPFADFTRGVPTATPPGATPPVSAEPKKVLPTQPQQTQGAGDNSEPGKYPDANYSAIAARQETPGHETVKPGQGNVMPSWACESVILTDADIADLLDEAKKWDDKDDKGKKIVDWKMKRKQNMRSSAKAEKKSVKEGVNAILTDTKISFSEDVAAILSGETLSEDFKTKATTVFEAAVTSRVREISEMLDAVYSEELDNTVHAISTELEEKVNDYLNYMVQEWISENEIAIEAGLKSEIVEDFISGLKNLFVEHYIDIPDDKVDIVSELSDKVAELEEQLNNQLGKNIELSKKVNESLKEDLVSKICEGLVQTQVEKVRSLAEGVEFTTEADFTAKLTNIKDSYFPTKVKVPSRDTLNENALIIEDSTETIVHDPMMRAVVDQLSRMKN